MTAITKIVAQVATADVEYAGTQSRVYLGIAGREFRLATGDGDFARGAKKEFVFGDGTNVLNPEHNDPRLSPVLETADLDHHPVYLRMGEDGHEPAWCLDHVLVTVNPGPDGRAYDCPALEGTGPEHRTWLEEMRGTVLHLRRRGASAPQEATPAPDPELSSQLKQELGRQLGEQLKQELGRQLSEQLKQELGRQLSEQLKQELGRQLGEQLKQELGRQLTEQLTQELSEKLRRETDAPAVRIVHGSVRANGTVEGDNSDFVVQRVTPGIYTIQLRQPFTTTPTATATIAGRAWRLLDNVHVVKATPQEIEFWTGDDRGNKGDRDFHFQIIERARQRSA
ncbi:hypothetical protein [Streptomyces sp. MN13]